jgi:hypothetical protein
VPVRRLVVQLKVAFLAVTLILAAAIVPVLPARAADQLEPPAFWDAEVQVHPTLARDPLLALLLGDFVAKFEETTLDQILDVINVGTIQQAGDAGESHSWICYSLPDQRLWLLSGEGTLRFIEVVAEAVTPPSRSSPNCPMLPKRFRSLSLGFGWIGTDRATLLHALGRPSGTNHAWMFFYYLGKQLGPYQDVEDGHETIVDWDVSAFVQVLIRGGRVAKLAAIHDTTN